MYEQVVSASSFEEVRNQSDVAAACYDELELVCGFQVAWN